MVFRGWLFYGLDLSVKYPGMKPKSEVSHYLLNVELPPNERVFRSPDEWYRCMVWQCIGQHWPVSEWELTLSAKIAQYDETYLLATPCRGASPLRLRRGRVRALRLRVAQVL